jgi:hypothetical protein
MKKLIKDISTKIAKRDTVNLAKALTSPKALAAQKNAASIRPRPMGLKTDSASNMVKALTSPKAKAMRDSILKTNIKKTGKMPMGLKADTTQKIKVGGGPKPSVMIKKQTTFKPKDIVDISKSKNPILRKKIVGVTPKKAK